ncbi:MAG TPA: helix-turn-helix transcriptional regulator [Candidatus Acidoferrales bacterium]|nr:helix-turn-helix transcriptional regulator [Candidatus Acidoferrales bacterium]
MKRSKPCVGQGGSAELSYAQFARKTGLSHQTLYRIEHGEHHLTLDKLETVLVKLKIHLKDVFPDEC